MQNKIILNFLKISLFIFGISFFVWAFSDSQFRDVEGFPKGEFCLPISIGIALILLGCGVAGRFRKSTFWFVLALIGQAVTLQLIEAGPYVRYQHYKPFNRLLIQTHPFLLIYLAAQTALVVAGLKNRWPTIRGWIGCNFKFWQLLGIGVVFFISSATVSQEISRYALELIFATFVQAVNLGNIILMVWALPEEVLISWRQRFGRFFSQPEKERTRKIAYVDRFAMLAAGWVTVFSSVLCLLSYQCCPHIPDEVMYLYQARYLANGSLTVPAPAVPKAFSFYMIPFESHRWYSIFPPGWPLVLALGVLLGVPWLVNPVLAGLNILLCYIFIREIADHSKARVAVFLLCVSPWYIFMAMNFMSHTFTLTCALIAALGIARARRTGKAIWGWLGGVATGMVSLIRPLDGVIVAGLLGLWAIGVGGRRLKFSPIIAFVLGAALMGGLVLPYNKHITGNPTVSPLTAYYEKYFGHKSNALGFGPERGLGWAIDPFPGHRPLDALVNANLNIFSINIELFGWSTGSLLLIALLLFSKNKRKGDYLMFIIIFVIAATFSLYWFSGGPDFGARYWYLMIIPLIGLTVRGIQMLQEKFEIGASGSPLNSTRVTVAILSLSLISVFNFFPWRAIDKYHHYRSMRPDIRELAKKYDFGKSLVLIRGNYSDYQSAWSYNPVNFKANAPIYAWDRNRDIRDRLLDAYPDRPIWVINGSSVTNAEFRVLEGPLSAKELLAGRQTTGYHLSFSTYIGGSNWEHARDVFADAQGNVYITGGTASPDFPTTPGAYDRTYNTGGSQIGSAGNCDAFVCKFDSNGSLIWSTYLGGPNYDRGYGIEVDTQGYVYIAGRAGPGFPVTSGAFQTNFQGVDAGIYGMQNGFVAKLSPDGSQLIWASYVGVSSLCRDLAVDASGNVYTHLSYDGTGGSLPSAWFANAYQSARKGGMENGAIKISSDGSQVLWATWLGGTGDDVKEASIRVDASGYVYLAFCTRSTDIPTTAGAHDQTYNGGVDFYVAKLTPDGSGLVYGTYIGDAGDNWNNTHNLAVDNQGNAYISVCATGSSFPTTSGAFQTTISGGIDWGVAKFSPTGSLISSTLIGGNSYDNPDGMYVDNYGNVYISGATDSSDFPITSDAFQSNNNGGSDAVLVILSADFTKLLYSTYMGGSANDNGRSGFMDVEGKSFYITGSTNGSGWPVKNAYQDSFAGALDCILAKFNISEPALPTVGFSSLSSGSSEGVSPVALAVELSAASGQAVTVDYSVAGGTATGGGVDFTFASGTLTFSPGDTTETIAIAIMDDSSEEQYETIVVTLSNPVNATLGTNLSHTYTIIDNDGAPPETSGHIPEPNSIQAARDTIIQLHITDDDSGVAYSGGTVTIQVEGDLIYDGANESPEGVYDSTGKSQAVKGVCRRSGTPADYTFVFQPSTLFDYEQKVDVAVSATDKAGNSMIRTYYFYTVMRKFGKNVKVNSDTVALFQDHPATATDSAGSIWVVWDQTTAAGDTDIYIGKLQADSSSLAG